MKLQDALFNWVQIKIAADARPDDAAAKETAEFFEMVLREDHQIDTIAISQKDDTMIHVRYETEGKSKVQMFDRESVEQLLQDINANPKYNE